MSDKDDIIAAIKEGFKTMNSGTRYDGGGSNYNSPDRGGWQNSLNFFKTNVDSAGDFTGRLVRNQATAGDAISLVTKSIGSLNTGITDFAAKGIEGTAKFALESVENWKKFSDVGVSMYGNAMLLTETIGKTGLRTEEFADILQTMGANVTKFGGTMTLGTQNLSNMMVEFNDPDRLRQFAKMGIDQKAANDTLALVIRGASSYDLATKEGQASIIETAKNFAVEIDKTAKITGVSRKQLEDNVKKAQDDSRVFYAQLKYAQENPQGARAMNEGLNAAKDMNSQMRDYFVSMSASAGTNGGQYASQISASLPQTANLIREIAILQRGTDADQKEAVRLSKTITDVAAREVATSTSAQNQGVLGEKSKLSGFLADLANDPAMRAKIQGYIASQYGPGVMTPDQKATAEQQGKTPEGKVTPGAESTEAIMNANQRLREGGAETIKLIGHINKGFDELLGKMNSSPLLSGVNPDGSRYIQGKGQKLMGGLTQPAINADGTVPEGSQGIYDNVKTLSEKILDGSRHIGTEGVLKSMFEPKDATLKIKAGENVLDPQDAQLWANAGGRDGIAKLMQSLGDTMPQAMTGVSGGFSTIMPQMSSILKNIPAQISSAQPVPAPEMPDMTVFTDGLRETLEEGHKELNSIMASMMPVFRQINDHMANTAKNTKGISGNVY